MIAVVGVFLSLLFAAWDAKRVRPVLFLSGILALALIEIGNSTGFDYVHVEDKASLVRPRLYQTTSGLAGFLKSGSAATASPTSTRTWYSTSAIGTVYLPSPAFCQARPKPRGGSDSGIPASSTSTACATGSADKSPRMPVRKSIARFRWLESLAAANRPAPRLGGASAKGGALPGGGDPLHTRPGDRPTEHRRARPRHPNRVVRGEADVVFTAIDEQHLRLDASPACAGVLVLSDNWYPGWQATLDGRPIDVLRADAAIRAVAMPAGSHRVEMHYRPSGLGWAATLSLVTLAVVLTATVWPGRRIS